MELRNLPLRWCIALTLASACGAADDAASPAWRVDGVQHLDDGVRYLVDVDDEPLTVTVVERDAAALAVLADLEGDELVSAFRYDDEEGLLVRGAVVPLSSAPDVDPDADPYLGVTLAAARGELEGDALRKSSTSSLPWGGVWGSIDEPPEDPTVECLEDCDRALMICDLINDLAGPDDTLNPFCADDYYECVLAC